MKEIGEYLKNRRLELGISLDDAEQYLKIRKKYLIAIEEGDESVLPGKTYFVGYLRNYANYLETDQETIDQLLEKTEQKPKPIESETVIKRKKPGKYLAPEKRKYRIKREKKSFNFLPLIKIAAIMLIIAGLIFIINQFIHRMSQSPILVTQEEASTSETILDEEKSLEQELVEMAEENIQKEEIAEEPSISFLEPLPDYKPINITAEEPTWVKIMQDNQILFESIIFSAEEITIKSEEEISLLTNSSKNLSVSYDGQMIEPQPSDIYPLIVYQIIPNDMNN